MAGNGPFSRLLAHRARMAPAGQQSLLHAAPPPPAPCELNLESGRPERHCQCLLCHLPAVWPYASDFTSQLAFCSPLYKWG